MLSNDPSTAAGPFATVLNPGESIFLFGLPKTTPPEIGDLNVNGETVAVGESSIAVCFSKNPLASYPPSFSVELSFVSAATGAPAAPGAFEVDIQEADTDADAFYLTPASVNLTYQIKAVGNATTEVTRADFSPTGGKFIRANVNALETVATVNVILKLTRMG